MLRTNADGLGKYLCGSVVFSNLSHFEMGIRVMRKVFIDYSYSLTASRNVFVPHILGILASSFVLSLLVIEAEYCDVSVFSVFIESSSLSFRSLFASLRR